MSIVKRFRGGHRPAVSTARAISAYSAQIGLAYNAATQVLLEALGALYGSVQIKMSNSMTPKNLKAVYYAEVRRQFRRTPTRRSGPRLAATCALAKSRNVDPSHFVQWAIKQGGIRGAAAKWLSRTQSVRKRRTRSSSPARPKR